METPSAAQKLKEAIDALEAQRVVETIKLRNQLVTECQKLMPQAIEQARGKKGRKRKDGTRSPDKPGSPALLRLIARVAMRPTQIERSPKGRR
jgi:hypothetical protein